MDETLKKRASILMAAVLITMSLVGCGTPMYDLTDDEANLIANYCASCVAKFNRFQGDGMVFVVNKTTAEQQASLTGATPEKKPADDTNFEDEGLSFDFDGFSDDDVITISDEHYFVSDLSIGEILGYPDLTVRCQDVYVADEYKEGTYLLLTPSDGYAYLVMKIEISNPGDSAVDCDFISKEPKFYIELSDGTRAASSGTILLDDFYTFQGTVAPGESAETVALVEIPKSQASDLSKVKIFLESMGNTTEIPLLQ